MKIKTTINRQNANHLKLHAAGPFAGASYPPAAYPALPHEAEAALHKTADHDVRFEDGAHEAPLVF